ncbi:MAG: hypothetical protein ACI90M_003766, partial [Candidatus Azotimanducaceae bacterium]
RVLPRVMADGGDWVAVGSAVFMGGISGGMPGGVTVKRVG